MFVNGGHSSENTCKCFQQQKQIQQFEMKTLNYIMLAMDDF